MGEFTLSGNTSNIGLSAVEIGVNNSKTGSNPKSIFYTTPTPTSTVAATVTPAAETMQDELVVDKTAVTEEGAEKVKECTDSSVSLLNNDLSDKLNEQNPKSTGTLQMFHPVGTEPGTTSNSGQLWSTAVEDNYVPNLNGGLAFQNFPFGNNVASNQGRRAITASHNFPHNVGRQQAMYKGFNSWANPGQSWSGNSSVWNRGRSVPNLTPLQQMGVAGRKPSPTFNHQQVISPVKFRRSTSYPGKGPFPQPPTFEITNMDETRELLPYQVNCRAPTVPDITTLYVCAARYIQHCLRFIYLFVP